VIGVIGLDARSVALPAGIADLEFTDPVEAVAEGMKELQGSVDLVVVLAHQGKTGPVQSDAEARPEVQRDADEDIRLAEAVPGIAVLIGGHAHRGIETPIVTPTTGTLVVQTYGYGTRLGYLKLRVQDGRVVGHEGKLMPVWTDQLTPDPVVTARLAPYGAECSRTLKETRYQEPIRSYRSGTDHPRYLSLPILAGRFQGRGVPALSKGLETARKHTPRWVVIRAKPSSCNGISW
jgi:2',3'-cyclic-nucleotide 2'-phosphodiesterase (5'-nucleotidase family)